MYLSSLVLLSSPDTTEVITIITQKKEKEDRLFAKRYFQKQKRHMDFYFHAPYAIIKYLIKAVLVTAPSHVAPGLLKWFVWYQTV